MKHIGHFRHSEIAKGLVNFLSSWVYIIMEVNYN